MKEFYEEWKPQQAYMSQMPEDSDVGLQEIKQTRTYTGENYDNQCNELNQNALNCKSIYLGTIF